MGKTRNIHGVSQHLKVARHLHPRLSVRSFPEKPFLAQGFQKHKVTENIGGALYTCPLGKGAGTESLSANGLFVDSV